MSPAALEGEEDGPELNVTPLVDVALVLVIIFMVTAPLLRQPTLEVHLPKSASEETKDPVQLAVTMAADGRLALNEKLLKEAAVVAAVEKEIAESPDALVVLRADAGVDATRVVEMAKKLRAVGAVRVAVGTDYAAERKRSATWRR